MTALVAYASKNGSTAEIAQAIAGELRGHGLETDCREAGEVRDLKAYDAVVLGSAVYMKRWRPSARRFLRRHRASLPGLPWWVFNSGSRTRRRSLPTGATGTRSADGPQGSPRRSGSRVT